MAPGVPTVDGKIDAEAPRKEIFRVRCALASDRNRDRESLMVSVTGTHD